jgi:hypothetical protein
MLHDDSYDRLRRFAVDLPEMFPEPYPAQGDQDPIRASLDKIEEANAMLNQINVADPRSVSDSVSVAHKLLLDIAVDAEELQPLVTLLGQLLVACDLGGDVTRMAEDTLEQVVPELENLIQEYKDTADEPDPDPDAGDDRSEDFTEEELKDGPDEIQVTNQNMNDVADAVSTPPSGNKFNAMVRRAALRRSVKGK